MSTETLSKWWQQEIERLKEYISTLQQRLAECKVELDSNKSAQEHHVIRRHKMNKYHDEAVGLLRIVGRVGLDSTRVKDIEAALTAAHAAGKREGWAKALVAAAEVSSDAHSGTTKIEPLIRALKQEAK